MKYIYIGTKRTDKTGSSNSITGISRSGRADRGRKIPGPNAVTLTGAGRVFTVCLMTLCLTAAMFNFIGADDSYAASSPFISNSYTHDSRFDNSLILDGLDVSYWQSEASNWKTAKKKGVDFAILRVTYTGTTTSTFSYANIDSKFSTHYKKAKAQGIMVGAYVFSQASKVSEAKKEATYAVKRLKALGISPKDLDLPLYMDYEYPPGRSKGRLSNLSRAKATACVNAFCDVVRRYGYEPGVYASTSFYNNQLYVPALEPDIDLWCAQYNYRCTADINYTKWQYTSSATIGTKKNGILHTNTGKVGWTDANFWYIDKKKTGAAMTEIYGAVTYNSSSARPALQIYNGNKLLTEGTDYTVKVIENTGKKAYALIRGAGDYKGYALLPLKFNSSYIEYKGLKSGMVKNHTVKDTSSRAAARPESFDEDTANAWTDDDPSVGIMKNDSETEAAEAGRSLSISAADKTAGDETCEEAGFAASEGADAEGTSVSKSVNSEGAAVSEDGVALSKEGNSEESESAAAGMADPADIPDNEAAAAGAEEASVYETAEEQPEAEYDTFGSANEETDVIGSVSEEAAGAEANGSKVTGNYTIRKAYIGKIPAGTTAGTLLRGLDAGSSKYRLDVIDNKGVSQNSDTVLKTGMLLGVYDKSGALAGTAELRVEGSRLAGLANHLTLRVKQVTATGLTAGSGSFTITVRAMDKSESNGYQVRYSTSSYMTKPVTKNISNDCTKVSKKISGLTSGKNYYVQVRTVRNNNGKKYYSAWGTYKKIKVN